MTKRKYNSGDIDGTYEIIEYIGNNKIRCRCIQCHAVVDVFVGNIPKQQMCKYCRATHNTKPRTDLTGRKFGRLTVVRSVTINKHTAWECVCDCGNTVVVKTCHLNNGHTKSCGCYRVARTKETNTNDLTGRRFGRLTVLSRTPGHRTPAGQNLTEYLCKCDCGTTLNVLSMNLVSGNTQSCGCIGNSRGELQISETLKRKRVRFIREYSFSDLLSENGNRLRFDFALFKDADSNQPSCLIEYNGEQHYYTNQRERHWFGRQQRDFTDKLKLDYCTQHDIPLYIIRYDEDIDIKLNEILST